MSHILFATTFFMAPITLDGLNTNAATKTPFLLRSLNLKFYFIGTLNIFKPLLIVSRV